MWYLLIGAVCLVFGISIGTQVQDAVNAKANMLRHEEMKKSAQKEVEAIKKYINEMRVDALKNHGANFGVLTFIQRLEEAFTWVRDTKQPKR